MVQFQKKLLPIVKIYPPRNDHISHPIKEENHRDPATFKG